MIDQELFFIKSSINNGSENYVLLEKRKKII